MRGYSVNFLAGIEVSKPMLLYSHGFGNSRERLIITQYVVGAILKETYSAVFEKNTDRLPASYSQSVFVRKDVSDQ